ncbi:MAG: ABC transporter permease [Lachnospiraceae bacterium]|nr:ABC transporter permease [Lachnospiraceae bacterium]
MKYFAKKCVALIITLFLISVATFLLFQVVPGDPVLLIVGTEDVSPERVEQIREQFGLNDGLVTRYFNFVKGIFSGDLGTSYVYRSPVAELIKDKLLVTLMLALISVIIIVLVAFPLGIMWARVTNKYIEAACNVLTQISMSIPSFFIGILVIYIFSIILNVFVAGRYVSYDEDLLGFISYLMFPAIAISLPKIAMVARFLRNAMLDEMNKDYVRTAYSKGCSKNRVMYLHVLRNALIPVLTFMGVIVAEAVAGSIVVEQVFGVPGIGRLLISSISNRDYPVVQILILYMAAAVIIIYFILDVVYRIVDPRIRRNMTL